MTAAAIEIRTGKRPGQPGEPCTKAHREIRDVAGRPLPMQPCEGGFLFYGKGQKDWILHCSVCHGAAGEDVGEYRQFMHYPWEGAISLDTLATWHRRQVEWTEAKILELADKLAKNHDALREQKRGIREPVWGKLFALEAQYAWLSGCRFLSEGPAETEIGSLGALERAGHVLCCPRHGIPGITTEELQEAYGQPEESASTLFHVLSLRSFLTGEARFAWMRWCIECAPLQPLQERFLREWQEYMRSKL